MEDFLVHTRKSVDKIAEQFDARNDENEIIKWMRNIVHDIYLQNFGDGSNILELNCGTGEDAIFLAKKGMRIYATDLSPEMIKIAQNKIKKENLGKSIESRALSFDEINLVEKNNFDGVVSNFGGLNCINNFEKLGKDLSEKMITGGKFAAVVMNKFCPWEVFYYIIRFDFKNAFRRFSKEGIYADLNGEKVKTFYFYPIEFGRNFGRHFEIEKIYTLGLFTPSPYLFGIYRRFKPIIRIFMSIDKAIKNIFPFNRIGDHFIIVMKKV